MLKLSCRKYLEDYCQSNQIEIEEFNEPVEILPNAKCARMFSDCTLFNQPVIIPESVTNCENMFSFCFNFNQPITIQSNIKSCKYMLNNCFRFDQPVNILSGVKDCEGMFNKCNRLNKKITIPDSIKTVIVYFITVEHYGLA